VFVPIAAAAHLGIASMPSAISTLVEAGGLDLLFDTAAVSDPSRR
jgi:hypothetical protein